MTASAGQIAGFEINGTKLQQGSVFYLDGGATGDNYFISSSNFHNENTQFSISKQLQNIEGVKSTFFGPDFVTITKGENVSWETINQDIINIFDKL